MSPCRSDITSCVHNVGVTFSEKHLSIDIDERFHLAYQGDCASDLWQGPHVLDIDLVRETGAHATPGEYTLIITKSERH